MSTSAGTRTRPTIEPICTNGPDLSTRSLRTRMVFNSPAWSPSSLSPMSRPSPVQPEIREVGMNEHDKATVERLEPRSRRNSPNTEPSMSKSLLRPISETALPTPTSAVSTRRPPLSAPLLGPPPFRRRTIVEETRNMLLFDPRTGGLASPVSPSERRESAPPGMLLAWNLQLQRHREHIRRRGLMGSIHPREADLMVVPVEHRRLSSIASSNQEGALLTPVPQDGRLTIRVVIHSRDRKPAVLTRTFDLDELRATIPDPSPSPQVQAGRRASLATLQAPPISSLRPTLPAITSGRRHSSGAIHGLEPSRSPVMERRGSRQELAPVPIHLEYARAYLPVLAAIILSEIVRPGDTIELPLPHPRAWQDTVAYVYTGRVEVTELIRQNILYLGGKV
ncbi:hypothetical protein G7046_g6087 [Stylonectria norvegica]|nr:hypothetical protein G7046_g6087 [Stylonectria norvegica]